MTFREQLAVIGGLLGRDVPVHELTRDEAAEEMGRFVPAPVLASLLDQWAAAVGRPAEVRDVEAVTGRPGRTFEQWAREHLDAFTART